MRYLFGFLCVCALGVALLAGRGCTLGPFFADGDECAEGCDDGNECTDDRCHWDAGPFGGEYCSNRPVDDGTPCTFDGLAGVCLDGVCAENLCEDVVCEDDGNECTEEVCNFADGTCGGPLDDGTPCDFDGGAGVCLDGVCEENLCENIDCEDDNECTDDECNYGTGTCDYTPVGDGTECDGASGALCLRGVCDILVDQCTATDLAAIDAGDEPDYTAFGDCRDAVGRNSPACLDGIISCVQDSGTTLTPECSSCFALAECCSLHYSGGVCRGEMQVCIGGQ